MLHYLALLGLTLATVCVAAVIIVVIHGVSVIIKEKENENKLPKCPECEDEVTQIIMQPGKATQYYHRRNPQDDYYHEGMVCNGKT